MAQPDWPISVNPDINSYDGYMPDEWAEMTLKPIPEGIVLERLVLDLAVAWRSASYTAQMPATSIRAMHATALGRNGYVSDDGMVVTYTDAIVAKLCQRVPEVFENSRLRARVIEELATIAAEFRDKAAAAVKKDIPLDPMWQQFMGQPPFQISLWGSQRVAYVAFYNAYETFIVDCLKVGAGLAKLRVTDKPAFNEALRTALGKDIMGPCWSHHEINISRVVRHALSHNGGRLTEDVKKQPHGIRVLGGHLQIMPQDNHKMLGRLRKAVEEVIKVVKDNPKFGPR